MSLFSVGEPRQGVRSALPLTQIVRMSDGRLKNGSRLPAPLPQARRWRAGVCRLLVLDRLYGVGHLRKDMCAASGAVGGSPEVVANFPFAYDVVGVSSGGG